MSLHPETAAALGNLLHKLSGNQKTRQRQLELIKEVEPGYRLPADVAMEQFKKETKAERDAEKAAERAERVKRNRASARAKLVDELGEDTVKAIEDKWLKKYPDLEYEHAAALNRGEDGISYQSTPPQERFRHGQNWTFPDLPGLLENPGKAASDMAYSVIDEINRGRRP